MFTITLAKGTFSGYFAPYDLLNEALAKFLVPASRWRKWNAKELLPSIGPGFQSAVAIKNISSTSDSSGKFGRNPIIRYITTQETPSRKLSPASSYTIYCQTFSELALLEEFKEITILEDSVLIQLLKEDSPEMIGQFLKDMASRSRGVMVLGNSWVPPISNMDSFFHRVGCAYELVMKKESGKHYVPDYDQGMIPSGKERTVLEIPVIGNSLVMKEEGGREEMRYPSLGEVVPRKKRGQQKIF